LESSNGDANKATLLNGEFVLYWLYREFDIDLNPFLTHWTNFCENHEEEHNKDFKGTTSHIGSQTPSKPLTRFLFIKDILAGKGEEVKLTWFNRGHRILMTVIQLSTKTPNEIERELRSSQYVTTGDSTSSDVVEKSQNAMIGTVGKDPHLLDAAQRRKLELNDERHLILQLPQLVDQIEIDTSILVKLLSHNPTIANSLIDSILNHNYPDRENLLTNILPRLDLELLSLDCINRLVSTDAENVDKLLSQDEKNHLLHLYIANAIREIDEMPQVQTRKIRLLCLFLDNLLRKGIIDAEEFFYEFQEIRYRFIWVKEARNLSFRVFGDGEGG